MAMLEQLTAAQEKMLGQVAEEYIRDLTSKAREPDMAVINRWLDTAYGLFELKRPARVEVVASPMAGLKLEAELTGKGMQQGLDYCGLSEAGWVAFYDLFNRIGVATDDEVKDVLALRDFGRNAWDTILLDECAIVVRRPTAIRVDDEGNLHAGGAPCIEWADGELDYAWHGTWIPERIAMDPSSFTRDEYLAITNTEHRRALGEIGGWQWVAELLGATPLDKWKDKSTNLSYELLACSDGSKLLRKQSPKLKNGKQPIYCEPVHEDLKTARAARKWQATTLTPAQCEADPELRYAVEA